MRKEWSWVRVPPLLCLLRAGLSARALWAPVLFSPHCMLHTCPESAHFTDEGTDPYMATEVPKGTCKPHKPWSSIVPKPAWANSSVS